MDLILKIKVTLQDLQWGSEATTSPLKKRSECSAEKGLVGAQYWELLQYTKGELTRV